MGDRGTAIKFYNQACVAVNDKSNTVNLTTSYQLFASACTADPTYAQAQYQMGNNNSDLNFFHAAIAHYRRALQCESSNDERAKTLCNLGWRLHTIGRIQESHACLAKSLDLDPRLAASWINLSQVHGLQDQPQSAVACARRGYEMEPDNPTNEIAYAFALLFDRQLAEGFKHFEVRFKWRLHSFLQYPYPKWLGEADKTVFLVADQGLGDTISFSRFVHTAAKRAKYIHCYIQPELLRLFMHAFIDIPNLNMLPFGSSFPQADAWTTFVSLPFALGLSDEEIRNAPDVAVPRTALPTSWMVPDAKLHIGIAWAGSALNDINAHRSIPVTQFLDLYRVPGIQLYSLQVGDKAEEANQQGAVALIKNLSCYVRDVTDTLALLRDLDLVITCESALGHIAALAGKECWIPYSYQGRDYRLSHTGEDRLWTPRTRVFRQGPDQKWEPVFEKIVAALREKLDGAF